MALNRKEELLQELNEIRTREIEEKLLQSEENLSNAGAINELKDAEAKRELDKQKLEAEQAELKRSWWAHSIAWGGDFIIKTLVAAAISGAFMWIVYQGSMIEPSSVNPYLAPQGQAQKDYFSLLSVVGPLFGLVLSYYFGKNKSSVNGE